MKTSLRILAGAVVLLTVSLSLSACDASPYAASVNGQVITQLTLNTTLQEWTVNKAYVTGFDQQQTQSTSPGIIGAGGAGTYTTAFAASTLGSMVTAAIVRQHLVATASLPSPAMQAVARGYYETSSYWYDFPATLRQFLSDEIANEGVLVAPSTQTSTLQGGYTQLEKYVFTQLCVRQESAFNLNDAQSLPASVMGQGALICYDQAALEAQPSAYRNAVLALAPGAISAPITTNFGYEVVGLVSRQTVPFDADTQKVLTVILDQSSSVALPALDKLISSARVKINPAYGTWVPASGSITPPQAKS